MRSSSSLALLLVVGAGAGVCLFARPARAAASAEALDELRQGYSLKQVGNCADAVGHLARSLSLDPTARAALNLSDCEQQLGELVGAQGHAAQGRDLARQQGNAELAAVADQQLAAIEKRLPRLVVTLAAGAPQDGVVTRDGVAMPATTLGAAVAMNPGAHVLTVSAAGHADRRFDVSLEEGSRQTIEVAAGPSLAPPPGTGPGPAPAAPGAVKERAALPVVPLVVLGLGAASLGVGLATGLAANAKHAGLLEHCDPQGACPTSEGADLDAFHALRTASTVTYAIGAAGIVAGGVLWIVLPARSSPVAARLSFGPGSAWIGGHF